MLQLEDNVNRPRYHQMILLVLPDYLYTPPVSLSVNRGVDGGVATPVARPPVG